MHIEQIGYSLRNFNKNVEAICMGHNTNEAFVFANRKSSCLQ